MSRTSDDVPLAKIEFSNDTGYTGTDWVSKNAEG